MSQEYSNGEGQDESAQGSFPDVSKRTMNDHLYPPRNMVISGFRYDPLKARPGTSSSASQVTPARPDLTEHENQNCNNRKTDLYLERISVREYEYVDAVVGLLNACVGIVQVSEV